MGLETWISIVFWGVVFKLSFPFGNYELFVLYNESHVCSLVITCGMLMFKPKNNGGGVNAEDSELFLNQLLSSFHL